MALSLTLAPPVILYRTSSENSDFKWLGPIVTGPEPTNYRSVGAPVGVGIIELSVPTNCMIFTQFVVCF